MEQIQQLTTQPDHVNTACAPHMEMTISPTSRQELLLKIAATFRDDVVLRNAMYRVRRWHA